MEEIYIHIPPPECQISFHCQGCGEVPLVLVSYVFRFDLPRPKSFGAASGQKLNSEKERLSLGNRENVRLSSRNSFFNPSRRKCHSLSLLRRMVSVCRRQTNWIFADGGYRGWNFDRVFEGPLRFSRERSNFFRSTINHALRTRE